jgi:hypothetical protein
VGRNGPPHTLLEDTMTERSVELLSAIVSTWIFMLCGSVALVLMATEPLLWIPIFLVSGFALPWREWFESVGRWIVEE